MISVIVPNFNKAAHLAAMLASVRSQTDVSQIIVIDDASTDDSVHILRAAAAEDPRIDVVEMPVNRNGSYCRNRGLERATGPYVIFLDSDDLLSPHCCGSRLTSAQQFPDFDLWVFPMHVFRDSPHEPLETWIPRPGDHLRRFLAHRLDWQTMQPLWRRDFVVQLGGFDESFQRLQDPEMHTRALLARARVKCFPNVKPDCYYRAYADDSKDTAQLSGRNIKAVLHFYRTFIKRVPAPLRATVTGTLFESLVQHTNWLRSGKISAKTYEEAAEELIAACTSPHQRYAMIAYMRMQRLLPIHIRGSNHLMRLILGLPA
jgi:glycosyltransferase involved in cell wall biosynthesis